MWSGWLVFCDCGCQSVCPLMEKDKRLMEASWWDRLTQGETGSCSDGRSLLIKSLIQFSVDGWSCFPSLLSTWGQTMVDEDNEDNGDLPEKIPCMYCYTQCPQPCSRPPLTHTSARDSQTPTGKSVESLLLSPGSWCTRFYNTNRPFIMYLPVFSDVLAICKKVRKDFKEKIVD